MTLTDCLFPVELVPPANKKRRAPGQTVIAHISDLHFTAETDFDQEPWSTLLEDLTHPDRAKVDVLAVTGDLIDASATDFIKSKLPRFLCNDALAEAFSKVHAYLGKLCTAMGIDPNDSLLVVPGNHDYRAIGVIKSKRQPQKFYTQFKSLCRPLLLPDLRLCVFVLDSNTMRSKYDLATGLIERDDLVKFRALTGKTRLQHAGCTKAVLLHHHPMPIPARENGKLKDHPGFTLLKNSGQFMDLMVKAQIDLVLHGHEHHPAFSKAFFPNEDTLQQHMISIVGAGSAWADTKSYNLITVTDGGQINLERRSVKGAVYEQDYKKPLGSYEDARRVAFDGLADKAGAIIKAEKFSKLYVIKSSSGDADIYELSEGVTAYSQEVSVRQTRVDSISGFFFDPKFLNVKPDTQDVYWDWNPEDSSERDENSIRTVRKARVLYSPALKKDRPVTYELRNKAYNLFHFNKQQRRDATDGRLDQELIEVTFQNAFELYVLSIHFPKDSFPPKFYREVHGTGCFGKEVHDETCVRDSLEEKYFNLHFSKFEDAHTVSVSIERPLPGYTYIIKWDLADEESTLELIDQGNTNKLVKKLLRLRERTNPDLSKTLAWLAGLRDGVTSSAMWQGILNGDDEMDIHLYVYNSETGDMKKRGLVCVASTLPEIVAHENQEDEVIKPGKTLIGATYRRKEPMIYSPLSKAPSTNDYEYKERVPGRWRRGSQGEEFKVVCALPLFYPIRKNFKGREIGVLAFSSKSETSKLLYFIPKNQRALSRQQVNEIMEKRDALEYFAMTIQFRELARLLEVEPPEQTVPGNDS